MLRWFCQVIFGKLLDYVDFGDSRGSWTHRFRRERAMSWPLDQRAVLSHILVTYLFGEHFPTVGFEPTTSLFQKKIFPNKLLYLPPPKTEGFMFYPIKLSRDSKSSHKISLNIPKIFALHFCCMWLCYQVALKIKGGNINILFHLYLYNCCMQLCKL